MLLSVTRSTGRLPLAAGGGTRDGFELPRLRFLGADEPLDEGAIERGLFRVRGAERRSRQASQKGNRQTQSNPC
ncbi:MAG TPA: hypothetical protein VJV78_15280 [Polyangiales bacterium]|nr:hypothetical protein [Polyangiales bacterium]